MKDCVGSLAYSKCKGLWRLVRLHEVQRIVVVS